MNTQLVHLSCAAAFLAAAPIAAAQWADTFESYPAGSAIEGQGVALGWRHLVEPLIGQRLLVRPVPQAVTTDQPIYLVASRRGKLRAEAVYLRDWLVEEAGMAARP